MATTGATGYDSVAGASAPGSSVTDHMVHLAFTPSASWWSAFSSASNVRVTSADGATEYPRDVVIATASLVYIVVMWTGAQSGTPSYRVYPDATGAYGVADTYGQYNAYESNREAFWPLMADFDDRTSSQYDLTDGAGSLVAGDATGQVGDATQFDGSEWLENSNGIVTATPATMMAWVYNDGLSDGEYNVAISVGRTDVYDGIAAGMRRGGSTRYAWAATQDADSFIGAGRSEITTTDSAWHHLGGTFGTNTKTAYEDGAAATADTTTKSPGTFQQTVIGARYRVYNYEWEGRIQAASIDSTERSTDWIAFEATTFDTTFWTNSGWTAVGSGINPAVVAYYNRLLQGAA